MDLVVDGDGEPLLDADGVGLSLSSSRSKLGLRPGQLGHYTAYCFNHNHLSWYHFDDDKVTAVSENIVKKVEA